MARRITFGPPGRVVGGAQLRSLTLPRVNFDPTLQLLVLVREWVLELMRCRASSSLELPRYSLHFTREGLPSPDGGGELRPRRLARGHLNDCTPHGPNVRRSSMPRLLDHLRRHPVRRPLHALVSRLHLRTIGEQPCTRSAFVPSITAKHGARPPNASSSRPRPWQRPLLHHTTQAVVCARPCRRDGRGLAGRRPTQVAPTQRKLSAPQGPPQRGMAPHRGHIFHAFGGTEVSQLDGAAVVHEQVGAFDVAVHDLVAVQELQPLRRDPHCISRTLSKP
jgi:hypothetical protein